MEHVLRAGALEATFRPEAGMLGASLRHRGAELLGQRDGVEAYRRERKTMGIPFLHPWANRLSRERVPVLGREVDASGARRDEHGRPNHGLLGPAPWAVGEATSTRLLARYAWDDPAFPFSHALTQEVSLTPERLAIATVLEATGEVAVPIAFGFHPYLALRGEQAECRLPVRARQRLGEDGLPAGGSEPVEPFAGPLGDRAWDDCFTARDPGAPFALEDGERRIEIALDDVAYPVAQIFGSAAQGFLCVEPMTAPVGALETGEGLRTVAPGEAFAASWSIEVSAA